MYLFVGLGNPGSQHSSDRHNFGRMVLEKRNLDWDEKKRLKSLIAIQKNEAIFCLPQVLMNESGISVQAVAAFYKILPDHVCIVHDDLDIKFGNIRHSFNRSSGGHNGVKSIIESLGSKEFHRLRLGILPAPHDKDFDSALFVLQRFDEEESEMMEQMIQKTNVLITHIIHSGFPHPKKNV